MEAVGDDLRDAALVIDHAVGHAAEVRIARPSPGRDASARVRLVAALDLYVGECFGFAAVCRPFALQFLHCEHFILRCVRVQEFGDPLHVLLEMGVMPLSQNTRAIGCSCAWRAKFFEHSNSGVLDAICMVRVLRKALGAQQGAGRLEATATAVETNGKSALRCILVQAERCRIMQCTSVAAPLGLGQAPPAPLQPHLFLRWPVPAHMHTKLATRGSSHF